MLGPLGIEDPGKGIRLEAHEIAMVGRDILHSGRPIRAGRK
jgi:hypothetical protein